MSDSDVISVSLATDSDETQSDLTGVGRTLGNVLSRVGRIITPTSSKEKTGGRSTSPGRPTRKSTAVISMTRSSDTQSNLRGPGRTLDTFVSAAGRGLSDAINRAAERSGWGPNNLVRDILEAEEARDVQRRKKLCSDLLAYVKTFNTNNQSLALRGISTLAHHNISRRKLFIELGAQPLFKQLSEKTTRSHEKGKLRYPVLIAMAELDDDGPNAFMETFVMNGRVWQIEVKQQLQSLLDYLRSPDVGIRSVTLAYIQLLCQNHLLYALMFMCLDADRHISSSIGVDPRDAVLESFLPLIQETKRRLQVTTSRALSEDYNAEWQVKQEDSESGSPGKIDDDLRDILCSSALNLFRSGSLEQRAELVGPLTRLVKKQRKHRRQLIKLGAPAILRKTLSGDLSENDRQTITFALKELEINSPDTLFVEFEEEWVGLGVVARVTPQDTLEVLCSELGDFLRHSDPQIQLSALRYLEIIAKKDRYCWNVLQAMRIIDDVSALAVHGPPAVRQLAAATSLALAATKNQWREPPRWSVLSNISHCPPDVLHATDDGTAGMFRALFVVRAPCPGGCPAGSADRHFHVGHAGMDYLGNFPAEIPLLRGVESGATYSPAECEWLVGDTESVRWLDVPRGQPFRVGEHNPVIATIRVSGEPEYVACGLGRGVLGDNHIGGWHTCSVVDGAKDVNIAYAYRGPGRTEVTDTMKVLVLAHDVVPRKE